MKKILSILALALAISSCGSKTPQGYKVEVAFTGDMAQLTSDTVIINNNNFADTALLADGKATFSGLIQTPDNVTLTCKMNDKKFIVKRFFLENCNNLVTVTLVAGEKPQINLKGGEYVTVQDSLEAIMTNALKEMKFSEIEQAFRSEKDPQKRSELGKQYSKIYYACDSIYKNAVENYIKENPTGMYALMNALRKVKSYSAEERDTLIASFKALPEYAQNKNLEKLEKIAQTLKAVQPGNKVFDFTQNDPDGNPIKFSDIYSKNKVTMIDFWASWCGPCRAFNPTLVKIYEKYHKDGFEVFGVSFDNSKEAWVKCIESEKLVWPQVSDLQGWNNAASDLFYIKAIPANLIVDQNGIILAYDMDRNEIENFVGEKLAE